MNSIGVYVIANTVNKKVYVGASCNIHTRLSGHRAKLRKGTHECADLQRDWDRLGENSFQFKVLEMSDAKNYVLLERKYIKGFAALSRDCVYNKSGVPKEAQTKKQVNKQPKRTGRHRQNNE